MSRPAQYLTRQEINSSTFTGSYQALGSAFADPAVLVKIINNSAVDIDVSTDGSTDHDFIPAGSFFLYDLRANHGLEWEFAFRKGLQFYVSGAVSTGSVYLIAIKEK